MAALEVLAYTVNQLPRKCFAPRRDLPWLGLWFNSVEITVSLPEEKALAVMESVRRADTVGRRVLDSLFGYLSFCTTVVYVGRANLHGVRRLRFRSEEVARAGHHRAHVSTALREDLAPCGGHTPAAAEGGQAGTCGCGRCGA